MKNISFLKIYSIIMIAGTLGLGFFIYQGSSNFNELERSFGAKKRSVNGLQNRPLFPNEANSIEKQKRVTSYVGAVNKLKAKVLEGQAELKEDLEEQDFRQVMNQESEAIIAMANKKKLILPENFAFGLDAYKQGKPFMKGAIGRLEWQLNATKQFIKIAADSGIDSIDEFIRDEFQEENEEPKEDESKPKKKLNRNKPSDNPMIGADEVMETYRFTTEITSSYESLTAFLNGLASDKDNFLWVRKLRIENETQTSPRVGERSLPVPVPGAVPDEDGNTSMIDAAVLFGNEKMRARIVIDAVLFKGNEGSEEEEKNKTAKS